MNGDNHLAKAAEKGLTEAIKCLLEAGANPNVPNTVRMRFFVTFLCLSWLCNFSRLVLYR